MRLNKAVTNIATKIVNVNLVVSVAIDIYRPEHINANDTIAFAAIKMKHYYDLHYQPIYFNIDNLVNLRLYKGY